MRGKRLKEAKNLPVANVSKSRLIKPVDIGCTAFLLAGNEVVRAGRGGGKENEISITRPDALINLATVLVDARSPRAIDGATSIRRRDYRTSPFDNDCLES